MFHLIVTNDEEVVRFARERGAGVFTAEKAPEGFDQDVVIHSSAMKPGEILRKLGVKAHIKGYTYLKYVLEKCANDPEYKNKGITKEIYPECAKHFNTTPSRVERGIRHALEASFQSAPEKYAEIFGGTFYKQPTNSEFIGLISEYFANE